MNSKPNSKTNRRKPKNKNNRYKNFQAPSYGMKTNTSLRTTVTAYLQLTTLTGTNGFNQTINWPFFQGGSQNYDIYRYFEITGWKIDVTLPTVVSTTDSFYSGAVALLPVNYLLDGISATIPTDPRDVLLMPGAVNVKDGQPNTGRWIPPTTKQVYAMSSFVSGGSRLACQVLGYFNDIGINETPVVVQIYCDIVCYGAQFQIASINYIQLDKDNVDSCEEIDDKKSTVSVRSAKKGKNLK